MILALVAILILIGSAVVGSLYSNFLVFYENFTETENYHKARYASVAAIERAELVIKQHAPGYIGSGGRKIEEKGSTGLNNLSDQIVSGFSYLSNISGDSNQSTIFWEINSRTDRIPSSGNGNVEKLLSTGDSKDYNMMDYENAEIFLLHYDNSNENPYLKVENSSIIKSTLDGITVAIRLPPFVREKEKFKSLNTGEALIAGGYTDDALVDRQLKGKYDGKEFTIFATQNAAGYKASDNDSTVRESDLNKGNGIELSFKQYRNPKSNNNDSPTIISSEDKTIENLSGDLELYGFRTLFRDTKSSDLQLRLSLLNLVLGGGSLGSRYPLLEYYVEFTPKSSHPVIVSDKYYKIQTEGNFGDYNINTIIYKPTITESILRSFTTIL